jgi:hypothetical protein
VTWTDAAWIRDSNLEECERRGADEIWVVWCIGNTPRYGENALEQYVNMIEMSAVGALNLELERIAQRNRERDRAVRVHVIKPSHPLPLDPWYLSGRIDGHTLVAMGYRDASAYLAGDTADGVPLDATATKMTDPPLGVRVSLMSRGSLDGVDATLRATVELHDVAGPSETRRPAVGSLRLGDSAHWFRDGECWWDSGRLWVRGTVDLATGPHRVDADLTPRDSPRQTTVRLSGPSGDTSATFTCSRRDVARTLVSVEPSAARGMADRVRAVRALLAASR